MLLMPENKKVVWIADQKVIISGQKMVINFYEYLVNPMKDNQQKKSI